MPLPSMVAGLATYGRAYQLLTRKNLGIGAPAVGPSVVYGVSEDARERGWE